MPPHISHMVATLGAAAFLVPAASAPAAAVHYRADLRIDGSWSAREHVRKVQRKLGVRSRGELQALMHDAHYEPWFAAIAA